jgi:undecaprenyl diphosphate synthase
LAAAPQPAGERPAPRHVAVIMDGNGRWARARGLPRAAGHQAGAEAVRRTIRACMELGVAHLTIYAFSSENWKRPAGEVDDLMGLMRFYIRKELKELAARGIRIRFIGDASRMPADVAAMMEEAVGATRGNGRLTFTVALNYGARDELVRTARALAAEAKAGTLDPAAIDEALFAARLDTAGEPDPDLIIRTSGEQRLSNFLLWQGAYAELVFTPVLWPDFGRQDLEDAIEEFHGRDRRYGAVASA